MRTVKIITAALVLALAGAVYAAGAMQDGAKTQEPAKAAKSCCRKQDGAKTAARQATKHDGESCCAGEGCCAGGSCCAEGCSKSKEAANCCKDGNHACCKAHKSDTWQSAAEKPGEKDDGCCGACACCGGKAGHEAHDRVS